MRTERSSSTAVIMDPSSSTSLSDWKLDVRFEDGKRYHDMPEGTHCWEQVERLGEGTCGEVWKEQCLSDNFSSSSVFRAVKHIDKRRGRWTHTSKREIKALTTFSDNNVVEVSDVNIILHWNAEIKKREFSTGNTLCSSLAGLRTICIGTSRWNSSSTVTCNNT